VSYKQWRHITETSNVKNQLTDVLQIGIDNLSGNSIYIFYLPKLLFPKIFFLYMNNLTIYSIICDVVLFAIVLFGNIRDKQQ